MGLLLSPIAIDTRTELDRRIQQWRVVDKEENSTQNKMTSLSWGVAGRPIDAQPSMDVAWADTDPDRKHRGIQARSTWMRMTPSTTVLDKEGIEQYVPVMGGGLLQADKAGRIGHGLLKEGVPQTTDQGGFTDFILGKHLYRARPDTLNQASDNRPAPGINEVAVKHTGEIGSITEITVKWTVFDFNTLEFLTPYYLRSGANLTIDFGWAEQLSDLESIPDVSTAPGVSAWNKTKYSNPNREFYYGTITTFEWSVRPDGAIECTTNLVTGGSMIMDAIIEKSSDQLDKILNNTWETQMHYMTDVHTYCAGIGFPDVESIKKAMVNDPPDYEGKYPIGVEGLENYPRVGLSDWDAEKNEEGVVQPYKDGDWAASAHIVGSSRAEETDIPEGSDCTVGKNDLPGITYNFYNWDTDLPFYFTWGWFEDNVLSKVLGKVNTTSATEGDGVGLTYRSVEWNSNLRGGKGGYQSTKLSGHPYMLSFNGWLCWLPTEQITTPFQMGMLHERENAHLTGQGSLLNGLARYDELGGEPLIRDKDGTPIKGVTQAYEVKDGALYIGLDQQKSLVDSMGRRPGRFNWRDHFEPALVEEDNGAGGTTWKVITRNIVISKRFVDEVFSHDHENVYDPNGPRFSMFNSPATKISGETDALYDRVFEIWKTLMGPDFWQLKLIPDDHNTQNCKIIDAHESANPIENLLKLAKSDSHEGPFFFPAYGINSIVKNQELSCEIPDEMALEIMYGSTAIGLQDGAVKTGRGNNTAAMETQALIELNTTHVGKKVADKVWAGMRSPIDDVDYGNCFPYDIKDLNNYQSKTKVGNLTNVSVTPPPAPPPDSTAGHKLDDQQAAIYETDITMKKKKQAQHILFRNDVAADLRENYESFRDDYSSMYMKVPPLIDMRAYFDDVFGDPHAYSVTPPYADVDQAWDPNSNEDHEQQMQEIIEWMKHFVGWIQWLQWTLHGGGLNMNQEGFDGGATDANARVDKKVIQMSAWSEATFMRKNYWWCIKYLTALETGDLGLFSQQSFLLPLKIKLDIDGIGGLRYGNSFMSDYVPEQYKDATVFQIGQIEHRLDAQGWVTSFEGLMRMIPMKEYHGLVENTTVLDLSVNADLATEYQSGEDEDPKGYKEEELLKVHRKFISEVKVGDKKPGSETSFNCSSYGSTTAYKNGSWSCKKWLEWDGDSYEWEYKWWENQRADDSSSSNKSSSTGGGHGSAGPRPKLH